MKVFDLAVARTGLVEHEVRAAGFTSVTTEATVWDHKVYYSGATLLTVRITGNSRTGRLLDAQLVGHWQAEVALRVDIFATALFHGMRVEELNDLDLNYTLGEQPVGPGPAGRTSLDGGSLTACRWLIDGHR